MPEELVKKLKKHCPDILVFMLLVAYFVFLMGYFQPAISTPDAQGYFAQARLIATEGKTWLEPESSVQYIGPHWLHAGGNRYFTTFPPGLPAILAVPYKAFGPTAALLVNPLLACLSLLGLFLLCRLWLGGAWALLATALMAFNQVANEHALIGDAHTAVAFFLIWALYFLTRWAKTNSPWWILGAGLFFGIIPAIRYVDALFCLAFVAFVLLHFQNSQSFWRSFIAGMVGVAIPVGVLAIHNQVAFGAFWRTGYALSGEQSAIGWQYFVNNWFSYLQQLMSEGCGLLFGLGLIGTAVLCALPDTRKTGILFALLIVPVTVAYMSYYWRPDPQSMRFLMPTFAVYTVAGVWLLQLLARNSRSVAWAGASVLLLITALTGLPPSVRALERLESHNAVLAYVTGEIQKQVSSGSVLITNEAISQQLDFIGQWRLVETSILNPGRARPSLVANGSSQGVRGRTEEGLKKYGNLNRQEIFAAFSEDVWRWVGDERRVYFIAAKEEIDYYQSQLSQHDKLVRIAEIGVPTVQLSATAGPRLPVRSPALPQSTPIYDAIFDFRLNGVPLVIVEWIRD
ncbi:MAG: glycosyltransferase family 39 protein [Chloroflexota bacterium]